MQLQRRFYRAVAAIALLAMVGGRAQAQVAQDVSEGYLIGGLVLENRSPESLTEVRLLVVASRSFVACGYIPPHGTCSTTFPLRRYQANEVQMSWERAAQPVVTPTFVVSLPQSAPAGTPLDVVVSIDAGNRISATMRPRE